MSAPLIAGRIARQLKWEEVDPDAIRRLVELARREDLHGWGLKDPPARTGDITSALLPEGSREATARLVAREDLVISGLPAIPVVLEVYGGEVRFTALAADGDLCSPGTNLGTLAGPARAILESERVLLNFLQRLSGIASLTRQYVAALGTSSTRLLDTRKTTPGYRILEKYAVVCGGGFNHRLGLYDRIMLKDNHLAAAGAASGKALGDLVANYRDKWPDMLIELEVDSLEQIQPALDAGIENLLLDNFSDGQLSQAIAQIGNQAATEASGGITLERLARIGSIGLDFISTGATVHQSHWKDIGLDWD